MKVAAIRNRQQWQKVMLIGDSLWDIDATPDAPSYMTQIGPAGQWIDQCTSATTIAHAAANITTWLSGSGADGVILQRGVNDLNTGTSAAALEAHLDTIVAACIVAGAELAVLDVLPWGIAGGWSAADQVQTEAYNALLPAWCVSNGAFYGAGYSEFEDPANPDEKKDQYTYNPGTDDIHFSVAGAKYHAKIADRAIMGARRRIKVHSA